MPIGRPPGTLNHLKARHHAAARLFATGRFGVAEVAKMLGVSNATLVTLRRNVQFRNLVTMYQEKLFGGLAEQIEIAASAGLERLLGTIEDPETPDPLAADLTFNLLDRAGFGVVTKTQNAHAFYSTDAITRIKELASGPTIPAKLPAPEGF